MFCNKCGAEIPENGKFCVKCGNPIEAADVSSKVEETAQTVSDNVAANVEAPAAEAVEAAGDTVQAAQPVVDNQVYSAPNGGVQGEYQNAPAPKEKKPVNKTLIIIIAGVVAALIVIGVVIGIVVNNIKKKEAIKAKTIDISKYVETSFGGYDTVGTMSVYFGDDLEKAIYKAMGKSRSNPSDRTKMKVYNLAASFDFDYETGDGLTNGDTVTIEVTYDEDYADEADVIIKGTTVSVTVEGLEPVEEVNPFDDIEVIFSGTSPYGYASYNNNSSIDYIRGMYYSFDKDRDLKVGDKVTLTIDELDAKYAINNGYKFTETSKTYDVKGLDYYAEKIEDVFDDALAAMKEDAEEYIEDQNENMEYYYTCSDVEYVGNYFLNNKAKDSWSSKNIIFLVYKAKISTIVDKNTDQDDIIKNKVVYLPVRFESILMKTDGTYDYYDRGIYGNTGLSYGWWSYVKGAFTEKEMYEDISSDFDDYSITGNDVKTSDFSEETEDETAKDESSDEDETTAEDDGSDEDETTAEDESSDEDETTAEDENLEEEETTTEEE